MKIQELEFLELRTYGYSDEKVAVWLDRVIGKGNYRYDADRDEGKRVSIWSFAGTAFECTHLSGYLDRQDIAFDLKRNGGEA